LRIFSTGLMNPAGLYTTEAIGSRPAARPIETGCCHPGGGDLRDNRIG